MAARRATKGRVLIRPGNPITFEIELKMNQATLRDVADAIINEIARLDLKEGQLAGKRPSGQPGEPVLGPREIATRERLIDTWSELSDLLKYLELARKLRS